MPSEVHEHLTIAEEVERLAGLVDAPSPGRLVRHRIDRERRISVMRSVFLDSDPEWWRPFTIMVALSAGIAALGLSQDSAATVIGAMIIAPLGAPIVALGAALAAAWPHEAGRMLGVVAVASLGVVVVAALLGMLLPNVTPTAQILARTSPDLRDLGVAGLAGAAGAYAYTRSSLSSTLVGVAIAVALVPPLATVGLMVEEHRWTLAGGAATLFAANFVGITASAVGVMLLTGFVPLPRLRERSFGVLAGVAAVLSAIVIVAVPLAIAYTRVIDVAGNQTALYRQVSQTVGVGNTGVEIVKVDRRGNSVVITVTNPDDVPAPATFEADLVDEVGPNVKVEIR